MSPSQDVVMGCYYCTLDMPRRTGEGMIFSSADEADFAFAQGAIELQARIKVRLPKSRRVKTEDDSAEFGAIIDTTYGRIRFNMMLPTGMDYYNKTLRSGDLSSIIADCYERLGRAATIDLLDDMMQFGFHESTRSGLSLLPTTLSHRTRNWRNRSGREEGIEIQAVSTWCHYRNGTLQPGTGYRLTLGKKLPQNDGSHGA